MINNDTLVLEVVLTLNYHSMLSCRQLKFHVYEIMGTLKALHFIPTFVFHCIKILLKYIVDIHMSVKKTNFIL